MHLKYPPMYKRHSFLLMLGLLAVFLLSAQVTQLDIDLKSGCNYFGNEKLDP